jgi:hypothetical protein
LTTRARLEGKAIQGIADALGLRGLGIEIFREHGTGWGRGVTAREIGIMSPITPIILGDEDLFSRMERREVHTRSSSTKWSARQSGRKTGVAVRVVTVWATGAEAD